MQASPIRMLQRVGRTGRHRDGKVFLLLSQGKEEQRHRRTVEQHAAVKRAIENPKINFTFFKPQALIFPPDLTLTCVERNFNLENNTAFLELRSANSKGISLSKANNAQGGMIRESIPASILKATPCPSFINNEVCILSYQKTLSPTFLIPHSHSTKMLVQILSQFDAIGESEMELDNCSWLDASKAKSAINSPTRKPPENFLPKYARSTPDYGDAQLLGGKLKDAIKEMSRFRDAFYKPVDVDVYVVAFQSGISPLSGIPIVFHPIENATGIGDLDSAVGIKDKTEAVGIKSQSEKDDFSFDIPEEVLLGITNLPDDFFTDSCIDMVPEGIRHFSDSPKLPSDPYNLEHPSEFQLAIAKEVNTTLDIAMGTPSSSIVSSILPSRVETPKSRYPKTKILTSALRASNVTTAAKAESYCEPPLVKDNMTSQDQESAPFVPKGKWNISKALISSELKSTPSTVKPSKKSKTFISRFIDTQAECEDGEKSTDNLFSASDIGSLADFIDDGESDKDGGLAGDETGSSGPINRMTSAPSSGAMMAFYRRTAFESQSQASLGVFKTSSKRFAPRIKLNFKAETQSGSD